MQTSSTSEAEMASTPVEPLPADDSIPGDGPDSDKSCHIFDSAKIHVNNQIVKAPEIHAKSPLSKLDAIDPELDSSDAAKFAQTAVRDDATTGSPIACDESEPIFTTASHQIELSDSLLNDADDFDSELIAGQEHAIGGTKLVSPNGSLCSIGARILSLILTGHQNVPIIAVRHQCIFIFGTVWRQLLQKPTNAVLTSIFATSVLFVRKLDCSPILGLIRRLWTPVTAPATTINDLPLELRVLIFKNAVSSFPWEMTQGSHDLRDFEYLRATRRLHEAADAMLTTQRFKIDGRTSMRSLYVSLITGPPTVRHMISLLREIRLDLTIQKKCKWEHATCRERWYNTSWDCLDCGLWKWRYLLDVIAVSILEPRRTPGRVMELTVIEHGVIEVFEPSAVFGQSRVPTHHLRDYEIITSTGFNINVRLQLEFTPNGSGGYPKLDNFVRHGVQKGFAVLMKHHDWIRVRNWTTTKEQGLKRAKISTDGGRGVYHFFGVSRIPRELIHKPKPGDVDQASYASTNWV